MRERERGSIRFLGTYECWGNQLNEEWLWSCYVIMLAKQKRFQ